MIKAIRAKLHGIRITGAELDYHGSVTLDPLICRRAGIHPLEFVYIWNKNNGERLSTYVIYGEAGSRICQLNGAAARRCREGDEVIIGAVEYVPRPEDLCDLRPRILIFDAENRVTEELRYEVSRKADGDFDFQVLEQGGP
ncbi:MAG: aspartate 1-decarboxylase [Deltaproteobacteria bacterium]|jgi:aspartate 1-decarboxylase|nr:aspartate 1-decarboxylase [Deltaproteobacteria bacterium]